MFSTTPITFIIIALNVIVSIIGFQNQQVMSKGLMWPYYIKRNGEYFRFIMSGFLHGDFMHLFFNMFTMYFFGSAVEQYFKQAFGSMGSLLFIVLYLIGLIVADIPSYFKNVNNVNYRSLGASGAVSAVVFAAILFNPWGRMYVYAIPVSMTLYAVLYIVYCIYASKRSADNVNHDAHMWGSLFGLAFTLLLFVIFRSDLLPQIINELKNPSLLGR